MSFYFTVEYRNPVKMVDMKNLVNEVNEMQGQLEELYRYVTELIEEGDKDTAREMIEANHEVIVEQLESGYQGMEQVAMLDILAQLRMSLHDFEEAEFLLDQVLVIDPFVELFSSIFTDMFDQCSLQQGICISTSRCTCFRLCK